ncbi:MAG: 50S ribosomal protein L24 [Pirellulales bacterium]|nr:50S ribosomal protein L24 [Pirellulales bacterium]
MLIRSGDMVEVRSGNARGTRAKVLVVLPQKGKLVVEGVNRVYRHMKRSQKNPQGGRLSKEMPIDASNVALVCPACGKPTRLGKRLNEDGGKVRYCRKCGADAGVLRVAKSTAGAKDS